MPLQPELAERAIRQRVAEPLGLSVEQAAQGILSIANATMIRILRAVSVARGHDPRDFTLIAYGGAGPLHATDLAEEMGIQMVIVPVLPGLFSALGLLYADMSADFVATIMRPLVTETLGVINEACDDLMAAAESWFARVDAAPSDRTVMLSADLRYQRQNYELNVGLPRHPVSGRCGEHHPAILRGAFGNLWAQQSG